MDEYSGRNLKLKIQLDLFPEKRSASLAGNIKGNGADLFMSPDFPEGISPALRWAFSSAI